MLQRAGLASARDCLASRLFVEIAKSGFIPAVQRQAQDKVKLAFRQKSDDYLSVRSTVADLEGLVTQNQNEIAHLRNELCRKEARISIMD